MSESISPMKTASRSAKTALDEFLSEEVIHRVAHPDAQLVIDDIITEPMPSSSVQFVMRANSESNLWPFFAAALVAVGVTLLIFAVAAKYVHI